MTNCNVAAAQATPAFEMNTPPLGSGDLLLLSNGPGSFVTVEAMAKLAEKQGAALSHVDRLSVLVVRLWTGPVTAHAGSTAAGCPETW